MEDPIEGKALVVTHCAHSLPDPTKLSAIGPALLSLTHLSRIGDRRSLTATPVLRIRQRSYFQHVRKRLQFYLNPNHRNPETFDLRGPIPPHPASEGQVRTDRITLPLESVWGRCIKSK